MFEGSPERSERLSQIAEAIDNAIKSAPTKEELDDFIESERQAVSRFLKADSTKEEFNAELEKIALSKPGGVVKFDLLPDFVDAVHIAGKISFLTSKEMESMIAHENDHRSRAEQLGVPARYTLQFAQGGFCPLVAPSVEISLIDDLPEEEKARVIKEILTAPERLSQRDLGMLDGVKS